MPTAQIVKWGNSLAVRIPRGVAERAGVTEGDAIVLDAERGQISLKRRDAVPSLKELVAQITADNRYEEIRSGPERGKERVEW